MTTTAVGYTQQGISFVGTSDKRFPKEIIKALSDDEEMAEPHPENHSEEDIIKKKKNRELDLTDIGASRKVCKDCEDKIKEKGIVSWTAFSGRKSRKRKKL